MHELGKSMDFPTSAALWLEVKKGELEDQDEEAKMKKTMLVMKKRDKMMIMILDKDK